jgi:hypothetical protein
MMPPTPSTSVTSCSALIPIQRTREGVEIERLVLQLGGHGGGQGFAIANRVDGVQRQAAVGEVGKGFGIFVDKVVAFAAAARGDGLTDADGAALTAKRPGDGT